MLKLIFLLISMALLLNCGIGPSEEPGLFYLGENPLKISLDDTSSVLKFKRVYTKDLRGRLTTQEPYTAVTLESGDSSKVGIYKKRQIIGLNTTAVPVTIYAFDDSGSFTTNFKVEVQLKQ